MHGTVIHLGTLSTEPKYRNTGSGNYGLPSSAVGSPWQLHPNHSQGYNKIHGRHGRLTPRFSPHSQYPPHLDSGESTMTCRYRIPDNLQNWKWPRHLNPYYAEVKAASAAWARSFGAFSPKAQYAYDRCDFSTSLHVLYNPTLLLTSE
jgi:hypothetical protein